MVFPPAMIAQIFILTAELTIPIWTQANEANANIETQPLTAETENKKKFKLI